MKPKLKDIIKNLQREICSFLLQKGGMKNGYVTWVEGTSSEISWETPNKQNMTYKEAKGHSEFLLKRLNSIDTGRYKWELSKYHLGHGAYRIQIRIFKEHFSNQFLITDEE